MRLVCHPLRLSTANEPKARAPMNSTFAIISDIHSNLEALKTVLADIDRRGINRIFCLGDVIGYGPDPAACLDLVAERVEFCLCGNHDHAVLYEPHNFN